MCLGCSLFFCNSFFWQYRGLYVYIWQYFFLVFDILSGTCDEDCILHFTIYWQNGYIRLVHNYVITNIKGYVPILGT